MSDTPLNLANNQPYPHTAESNAAYQWPEVVALCRRLGVAYNQRTTKLVITLEQDKLVIVTQEYQGEDHPNPIGTIVPTGAVDLVVSLDTTNLHNRTWRTKVPGETRGMHVVAGESRKVWYERLGLQPPSQDLPMPPQEAPPFLDTPTLQDRLEELGDK